MSWFPCTSNINSEMLFWQEINLHLQEWLLPNDHICLLLIKSQKRLCSLITSLLSPLSFAEEAGITLRAGDRIPSPSKHFLLSKDLCGLCWVDVGFQLWIHSSGQILPSAVPVQPQEQPGQGGYEPFPAQNLASLSFLKTLLEMHWGFLES